MTNELKFPINPSLWKRLRDWILTQDSNDDSSILYRDCREKTVDAIINEEDEEIWAALIKEGEGYFLMTYPWSVSFFKIYEEETNSDPELKAYIQDVINHTDLSDYDEYF